jgi:DNA-binding NarL/FixJ family response regulator
MNGAALSLDLGAVPANADGWRWARNRRVGAGWRSAPRSATPGLVQDLTSRELEILELIADGLSNEGIATELLISRRTVDAHVRTIFLKLGLVSHPLKNQRVTAVIALWSSKHAAISTAA